MIDIEFFVKKIRLNKSSILKAMNFLLFRDFSRIFLSFYEFILNLL